ncbi:MAG TPA: L-threonylcarbamoyladenylate synthase [Smithellaceae bacterium]|jgi:L-threonylcarbamoyladenylate synthase|nr:threonylcarbamoyl-AMP synthase [Syntrophaceae bacterium]HPV48846.1 L-threonylcarbamoyladenylate synthase [Smithellaceae bacterium]
MTKILKQDQHTSREALLDEAAAIVTRGGLIAYPTETIYGLGANATDEKALRRIFNIKGRDFNNPLPVIIGKPEDLYPLVNKVGTLAERLISDFWPGPLTIVFEASQAISPLVTAGTGKIGIRLPDHYGARQIAARSGKPLTATSANLSGAPECADAASVIAGLGDAIDAVVDLGKTAGLPATTVVDGTGSEPVILRQGTITLEEIMRKIC